MTGSVRKWMDKESLWTIRRNQIIIRVVTSYCSSYYLYYKCHVQVFDSSSIWAPLFFLLMPFTWCSVVIDSALSLPNPPSQVFPVGEVSRIIPLPTWGSYFFCQPFRKSTDKPVYRAGVKIKRKNVGKPLAQGFRTSAQQMLIPLLSFP